MAYRSENHNPFQQIKNERKLMPGFCHFCKLSCSESQLAAYDCVNCVLFTRTVDHSLIFKGDMDSSAFFSTIVI